MEKTKRTKKSGFLKWVIIIVIALVVLGFFGFDITDILKSPVVKNNLLAFWHGVVWVWEHLLKTPAVWIWDTIFVRILWELILKQAIENIGKLKGMAS